MNKQALLDQIDAMIQEQERQIEWLKSKRLGKIGNFIFPSTNKMIDQFIKDGTDTLLQLKKCKIDYENYDFNS